MLKGTLTPARTPPKDAQAERDADAPLAPEIRRIVEAMARDAARRDHAAATGAK